MWMEELFEQIDPEGYKPTPKSLHKRFKQRYSTYMEEELKKEEPDYAELIFEQMEG